MPSDIDLSVERIIPAPPESVVAVFFNPDFDVHWMKAVERAERLDPADTFGVGSRVAREASFLRRKISWTTEVIEYAPPHCLKLRISEGPFIGVVTYEVAAEPSGSRATIRNQGQPGQFRWMPTALISKAMRSALEEDLARLEQAVLMSMR